MSDMVSEIRPREATHEDHWTPVAPLDAIPRLGARVVRSALGDIAVFRTAEDEVFALRDRCPHKGGPLSQGIVYCRHVACPLHNWSIGLEDGAAVAPDTGCTASFDTSIRDGIVYVKLGGQSVPAGSSVDMKGP